MDQFIPVASERSVGKTIVFNRSVPILGFSGSSALKPDIALFRQGKKFPVSGLFPAWPETGCRVVDQLFLLENASSIKLIVPEINGDLLTTRQDYANPNCSTIQMVMALAPLHKRFGLHHIVVSTYQSVTGSGQKGWTASGRKKRANRDTKRPVHRFLYTLSHEHERYPANRGFSGKRLRKKEMKMVRKRKNPGRYRIRVSATTVRVPVKGGAQSFSQCIIQKPFSMKDVILLLTSFRV